MPSPGVRAGAPCNSAGCNDGHPESRLTGNIAAKSPVGILLAMTEEQSQGDSDALPTQAKRLRRLTHVWAGELFARYFLTVCTAHRAKILANVDYHERLRDLLLSSPGRYGSHPLRYVVMPDHIHLLAVNSGRASVGEWMKALKAVTGQRAVRWQAGFFDHVFRNAESETDKWLYVLENPVRAGLVKQAKDWPFAGEIRFDAK